MQYESQPFGWGQGGQDNLESNADGVRQQGLLLWVAPGVELLAMPNYRTSHLFTDQRKTALDFAVGFMRTPVQMSDAVFADAQKYFSNQQLVEIAGLLTLVNLDRFNAAFGIGSAGFSEGVVCVPPERPVEVDGLKTAGG